MPDALVAAIGGNALLRPDGAGGPADAAAALETTLAEIADLAAAGAALAITHGNGPQVGHQLLRAEAARGQAYDLPLDVCVAMTQGELGYRIARTLGGFLARRGVSRPVACVLTQATVDPADPRLREPTKPVGPWYPREREAELRARGWAVAEDAGRGLRRLVPSPLPTTIVEAESIRRLVAAGTVVVAGGGGGVAVAPGDDGRRGVEAVIDKDYTTALVAAAIGAARVVDVTAVDGVKLDFGTSRERGLDTLTVAEARRHLAEGQFAPGSMEPKIEAAIRFLEAGGREVVVTCPGRIRRALDGWAGTRIRRGEL